MTLKIIGFLSDFSLKKSFFNTLLALSHLENAEKLYQKAETIKSLKPYNEYEYRKLIQEAAVKGHVEATFEVGIFYTTGDGYGYPRDMEQAYHWLRKAAEQDHPDAQFYMGLAYEGGHIKPEQDLFPMDLPEVYKWFKLVADKKPGLAKNPLTRILSALRPSELEDCERRYHEFRLLKK